MHRPESLWVLLKGTPMNENKKPPPADGLLNPEVWVDRYGDALYQFALYRVQIPDVAEDLEKMGKLPG